MENVPDSWDGDQEHKMVLMSRPYLSFTKRWGSITSSRSEIMMHVMCVTCIYILELDKGIDPNMLANDIYGH